MDLPPVPCKVSASARLVCFFVLPVCELGTHVAAGEVTTLKHEIRDDTVELGAGVAEALLASAEGAEVLDGLGDDVVEELEVDAAGLVWRPVWLAIGLRAEGRWTAMGL